MAHAPRKWRKTYLRDYRKDRGRTLESVAEKMGITNQHLGKVERGLHPYSQHILEIAALEYGCSVADLLTRPPAPKMATPPPIAGRRRA